MPTVIENFKKGDLLYGLNFYRQQLLSELKEKVESEAVIVDEYNKYIIPRFSDIDGMNEEKFREICKEFEDALDDPEFKNNLIIKAEFLKLHYQFLLKVTYPKVRLSAAVPAKNIKRMDEEQRRTRKACKARLLDKDMTIHFLLDGIDIRHCFDRAYSMANHDCYAMRNLQCVYDSYTTGELRFALKHYEEIKDHIKFYYNDVEVNLLNWLADLDVESQNALNTWVDSKVKEKKMPQNFQTQLQKTFLEASSMLDVGGNLPPSLCDEISGDKLSSSSSSSTAFILSNTENVKRQTVSGQPDQAENRCASGGSLRHSGNKRRSETEVIALSPTRTEESKRRKVLVAPPAPQKLRRSAEFFKRAQSLIFSGANQATPAYINVLP